MLDASRRAIEERLGPDALVIDVGAGAKPFPRADWVLDLLPYEQRGVYAYDRETASERFSADTWVVRDMCAREPWPFEDGQFDFAICSHTLEDIRDPIWVCQELQRVAKAGYIEVPSRLEEQTLGVQGNFAGWAHHRWLTDVSGDRVEFTIKIHGIHEVPQWCFPHEQLARLTPEQKVTTLWWEGAFEVSEQVLLGVDAVDEYLRSFVDAHGPWAAAAPGLTRRTSGRVGRMLRDRRRRR